MYRAMVQYSKNGMMAYDLRADTLLVAREKAQLFRAQGFYVEITDAEGDVVSLATEE